MTKRIITITKGWGCFNRDPFQPFGGDHLSCSSFCGPRMNALLQVEEEQVFVRQTEVPTTRKTITISTLVH
jgi:hypothetical protein